MFYTPPFFAYVARAVSGLAFGGAISWAFLDHTHERDAATIVVCVAAIVGLFVVSLAAEREARRLTLELFKANRSVRVVYVTEEEAARLGLPTPVATIEVEGDA